MKINRKDLNDLMKDQGFKKAAEWPDAKMLEKVALVPDNVKESSVAAAYKPIYRKVIEALAKKEGIEIVGGTPAPAPAEAKETKPAAKPAAKGKAPAAPESKEKPAGKIKPKTVPVAGEPEPEEKPAKVKKAPVPTKVVERDVFGNKLGSISNKVNEVLKPEWQSEQEIAEAAGVELDQARGRLYFAAEKKQIEYRKRIEYRLLPKGQVPPKAGK